MKYREKLVKELELNKAQEIKLDSILSWSTREYRKLSCEFRSRFDSLRHVVRDSIRAILTPEQKEKFERLIKKKRRR